MNTTASVAAVAAVAEEEPIAKAIAVEEPIAKAVAEVEALKVAVAVFIEKLNKLA